jgi:Methylase involved in ubiquinone/menaquinone biosynthesis
MNNALPQIFDPRTRALRLARAARLQADRFLWNEALEGVKDRLAPVNRAFATALALDENAPCSIQGPETKWHIATFTDGEKIEANSGYDLAVSILGLHNINDLPGVLVQIRRALKPDGLFVAAMFGGSTLSELRDSFAQGEIAATGGVSPRVTPMADVRELGALLQRAGFALPVADVERTTVHYRDFFTLVKDLRAMGETNALAGRKPFLSRAALAAALAHYRDHHSDGGGKLIATFDIVYLLGWAPDESQQKPLRPGSATMRLADALGVKEHKI